jgi:hypothetical protein
MECSLAGGFRNLHVRGSVQLFSNAKRSNPFIYPPIKAYFPGGKAAGTGS